MMAAKSQSPQNIDSEVVEQVEKARRRRFSASYKLKILKAVGGCSTSSERGQILREEGLYRSHLATWSKQRDEGVLKGLTPKKRGRKPRPVDPQARRVADLEREVVRLRKKLKQAETIIDVQKKLSLLLSQTSKGSP